MRSNLALKSAIAVALGVTAVSAHAVGDLGGPVAKVIATEIFGTGSQETSITAPLRIYTPTNPDNIGAGQSAIIKFTLGGGAVFGEALTDPAQLVAKGYFTVNGAVVIPTDIVVSAGGGIGDNSISITYKPAAGNPAVKTYEFGSYQIKNLTDALKAPGKVQLGVTYKGIVPADTNDSAPESTIFTSASGVTLTIAPYLTPNTNNVQHYINVADNSLLFTTKEGTAGAKDFTTPGLAQITYGSIQLQSRQALREDLTPFVFQGGDQVALTFAGGSKAYQAAGATLKANNDCTGASAPYTVAITDTNIVFTAASAATDDTLNQKYWLCLNANKKTEIEETTFTASADVNYFNKRYQPDLGLKDTKGDNYLPLKKNGVTQTIPFALSSDNFYHTTLRVVNTGTVAGKVNVKCIKNDGGTPTTGNLVSLLKPNQATAVDAAAIATACGTNGATSNSEYSYVRVIGEFDAMDAIEWLTNPVTGDLTQLNTNNLVEVINGTGGGGNN